MKHRRMRRTDLSLGGERAVLVSVVPSRRSAGAHRDEEDASIRELSSLAETAGADVVEALSQKRAVPDSAYYIGKGKADEVRSAAAELRATVVIFDNDLTPAQSRNLENALKMKVLDRTELILAIFGQRARSAQAKAQVELAQLEYVLPRLRRMWTHLERQVGGIGVRGGMGERQLEVDRRKIRKRIGDLTGAIRRTEKRREREVAARSSLFRVSLVGYTNAGKSSLMNALTGSDIFVEDRLFATLDSRTRAMRFRGGRKVLLSDTIGFIRQLPHRLVTSFHATLEEVLTADLLIHVVDAAESHLERQMDTVVNVLEEIGADAKPTVMVFNKVDLVSDRAPLRNFASAFPTHVLTSAVTLEGVGELKETISRISAARAVAVELKVPAADGRALAYLNEYGIVLARRAGNDGEISVSARIGPGHLKRLLDKHPSVVCVERPNSVLPVALRTDAE